MIHRITSLPNDIYWVEVTSQYILCMIFMRSAEFMECLDDRFRGKAFRILDYMEWYAATYGDGAFTYTNDWSGFNVSSGQIRETYDRLQDADLLIDISRYDAELLTLYSYLGGISGDRFYVIGTVKGSYRVVRHEYAHALWGTVDQYQYEQQQNIERLDGQIAEMLRRNLTKMGYGERVHDDEIQAYLSTDKSIRKTNDPLYGSLTSIQIDKIAKPFRQVFADFSQDAGVWGDR